MKELYSIIVVTLVIVVIAFLLIGKEEPDTKKEETSIITSEGSTVLEFAEDDIAWNYWLQIGDIRIWPNDMDACQEGDTFRLDEDRYVRCVNPATGISRKGGRK